MILEDSYLRLSMGRSFNYPKAKFILPLMAKMTALMWSVALLAIGRTINPMRTWLTLVCFTISFSAPTNCKASVFYMLVRSSLPLRSNALLEHSRKEDQPQENLLRSKHNLI